MVTQAQIAGRLDDLEAIVNGLMIYIAAKEAGVSLDTDDPKTRDFLSKNVLRESEYRLSSQNPDNGGKPITIAADGYWEGLASSRIQTLIEAIKKHYG